MAVFAGSLFRRNGLSFFSVPRTLTPELDFSSVDVVVDACSFVAWRGLWGLAGFVESCKALLVAVATFCVAGRRDFAGTGGVLGAVVGEEIWASIAGGGGTINGTPFAGPAA
jgi:hypothetical protein